MTHLRTSPYYPQWNGKIEAFPKTLEVKAIRPAAPGTHQEAVRVVTACTDSYSNMRLHSAIDYVTPRDELEGWAERVMAERDRILEAAREPRRQRRQEQRLAS